MKLQTEPIVFKELIGRKLMLCDVIYQNGNKETNWSDYVNFVYKDLVTKKKAIYTIKDPTITIYEVPEENRTFKKPRHYMEKEKLIPHEVLYRNVLKEIANIAGKEYVAYYNNHKTKKERQQLYKYPYVLGGDIPIETYYRVIWERELGNEERKWIDCCFLDIEVNQKNWDGPIPRHGECPIDMISVCDAVTKKVHTFYLKVHDNPQIIPFINDRQEELQQKLHERFDEAFPDFEYVQYAFDDEKELIFQVFRLIHVLKRDVCFIWNMDFDIPYVHGRCQKLNINPANVFCHSDFPTTTLYYHEDNNNFDWDTKRNFFECSSYTHYLDQPAVYAGLRRSQTTLRSVSLNAIATKEEVGEGKIKFDSTGGNFIMFSYNDFMLYDIYNVNDTLLQFGINDKCNDAYNLYNSCLHSYCNYKDGLKQTVSLRAFFYREFLVNDNLILGHNVNFDNGRVDDNEDDDTAFENDLAASQETFEGAINGDPELNGNHGIILFGKPSKYLFGDSIDFDFSAMYPNSICSFNIFAATMIGKLFIDDGDILKRYDRDAGKEFVEDLIAKNVVFLGEKWFGMPQYEDVATEVCRRLKQSVA
jgi:hypothetical protein